MAVATGEQSGELAGVLPEVARRARTQLEVERRWLLAGPPELRHPALRPLHTVAITQTYLAKPAGGEPRTRVRRLVDGDGAVTHVWTAKRRLSPLVRVEQEAAIDERTYHQLCRRADPRRAVVQKLRCTFTYAGLRFELDHLLAPVDCWLLEAELEDLHQPVVLPPFVGEAREVTDEPGYTNAALARRHR